jgi:hypothetical protein
MILSVFVWTVRDVIGLGFWAIIIAIFLCVGAWYGILSIVDWVKSKLRRKK